MRKNLLLLLILAAYSFKAQISFEKTYPNGSTSKDFLRLVKLSNAGYKYVTTNTTSINLYNLNHSLYQSIAIPSVNFSAQYTGNPIRIWYISDQLFDTNPATIEYLFTYDDNSLISHLKVFDQSGNILFSKDSVNLPQYPWGGSEDFITYTPAGVKMIIYNWAPANAPTWANVYALPGILPCHDCSNGVITSMQAPGGTINPKLINYPNPSSEQTTIEYELPKGQNSGEIVFYNETGTEIKRFKVTDTFHNIVVSVSDLEAGVYFYQLQATGGFKATKKMVVIK